jgi:tRNA pseudouridine55 synthase
MDKEYTGVIIIGQTTSSFDLETEITESKDVSNITDIDIMNIGNQIIGKQSQIAPSYSAIKIDGERAYHKARRGESVEIKARDIEIKEFEIAEIIREHNTIKVKFRVLCTKGTYIRAIARDFGFKLDNIAYLSNLVRTKIGQFTLSEALTLNDFKMRFPVPFKFNQT